MEAMDSERRAEPRLLVTGVTKRFGPIAALRDVGIQIEAGEIHALCGHNGAGKSTLVKILAGVTPQDQGSIRIDSSEVAFRDPQGAQRAGVALVDQEISLIDALSVADNVLLGLIEAPFLHRPRSAGAFVRRLLSRVGLADLNPATPVSALAMGQRQLVEIARALGRDASILILDEPTATLSDAEAEHVFAAVRSVAAQGASILFVSHRLGQVLQLCDRVTVLRDGAVVATAQATTELDRASLVEMMLGGIQDDQVQGQPSPAASAPSLRIRGLNVGARLKGVDLDVSPGQVVGLAGQVGCGASDCLRALAGLLAGVEGAVFLGDSRLRPGNPLAAQRAGLLYVSNDRKGEGLFLERTVNENLIATRLRQLARFGLLPRRSAESAADSLSQAVGLSRRGRSSVLELSGGNQQKAFIGRCLQRERAGVLLLDEPTRGVDVGGRADIHALIRGAAAAGSSVLFASTETDEILELADTVVTLYAGQVVSVRPRGEVTMRQLVSETTHAEEVAPR